MGTIVKHPSPHIPITPHFQKLSLTLVPTKKFIFYSNKKKYFVRFSRIEGVIFGKAFSYLWPTLYAIFRVRCSRLPTVVSNILMSFEFEWNLSNKNPSSLWQFHLPSSVRRTQSLHTAWQSAVTRSNRVSERKYWVLINEKEVRIHLYDH